MKHNLIITVGRQYGSGGRELGRMLSSILGIGYYDREIITKAAQNSGLADETFRRYEDRPPGSMLHALTVGFGFSGFSQESIFKIQSDTIREVADKESCVIVGRCADYVLRDNPMCFNMFVHAPLAVRAERVAHRRGVGIEEAASIIAKTDRSRAAYYNFYTDKQWGYSDSYRLCVDGSVLGLEESARLIVNFVRTAAAIRA